MSKCQFCEKEVPQKDGKRARLFCNGNCRNKYYYQKEAANKPKKKVGRPKKDAALKFPHLYVPKGEVGTEKPKATWLPPHAKIGSENIQSEIDALEKQLSTIAEGIYGTPMRNKIQDKITKLKRQIKDSI